MQTILSRVPLRSSCRCSSCFSLATKTSRRATTSVTRRQLTPGDVFTAFYTTILGTAALVDSKFKDDRRKELDGQLAAAREWKAQQTAKLDGSNPSEDYSKIHGYAHNTLLLAGATTNSAPNYSPIFDTLPEKAVKLPAYTVGGSKKSSTVWNGTRWAEEGDCFEDKLRVLDSHIKQSLVSTPHPAVTAGTTIDKSQSEAHDEWVGDADLGSPRQPRRQIHVKRMQEMIAKLVAQLLLTSKTLGVSSNTGADISLQMERMAAKIEAMEHGQTQLPSYRINDKDYMEIERDGLHSSLTTLLAAWKSGSDIELLVAKICYNLLVSTAPPNITTYNMLIDAFTRMGQHKLSQHVVDSFFFSSKFKPNTNTVCSILRHYAAKNDAHGFHTVVKRLRAADSGFSHSDMRLRKHPIQHVQESSRLKEWALTHAVVQRGEYLHQVFLRNTLVADAIIRGYLKLGRMKNAISQARAAIRLDILDHRTFAHVVECLPTNEFVQARMLLATIKNQFSTQNLPAHRVSEPGFRLAMRRLVSACGQYKVEVENSVLQGLMRLIELESISAALQRLSVCLFQLDVLLNVPSPDVSCAPTIGATSHTGQADRVSKKAINKAISFLHGYESIRNSHAKRSDSRRKDCIEVVRGSKALLRETRFCNLNKGEALCRNDSAFSLEEVRDMATHAVVVNDRESHASTSYKNSEALIVDEATTSDHVTELRKADSLPILSRRLLDTPTNGAAGYERTLRLLLPSQQSETQLEQGQLL